MPTFRNVNNYSRKFPLRVFGHVFSLGMVNDNNMNDNTKQIEAANRIGKMFLGCANGHAAFGYLTGYLSGELKWANTNSLNAEQLEKILIAASNFAKEYSKDNSL